MKINKGYKLFEMRDDGKLFPLFIGKTKIIDKCERVEILKSMNYDEKLAFAPYKASFEKRKKTA